MPKTRVVFFREENGKVPFLDWLDHQSEKAQDKCVVRLDLLRGMGHELRRPHADFLRDGIYELRVDLQGIHYRVLYFFSQKCGHRGVARRSQKAEGSPCGD